VVVKGRKRSKTDFCHKTGGSAATFTSRMRQKETPFSTKHIYQGRTAQSGGKEVNDKARTMYLKHTRQPQLDVATSSERRKQL